MGMKFPGFKDRSTIFGSRGITRLIMHSFSYKNLGLEDTADVLIGPDCIQLGST